MTREDSSSRSCGDDTASTEVGVSVIIPTHNRRNLLWDLLSNLSEQAVADKFEVLVVDSDDTEDIGDVVEHARELGLSARYIRTSNNIAGKRNRGACEAVGSTLIFADDDMRVPPSWIEAHLKAQATYPFSVVCGAVEFPSRWTDRSNYYRYKNTRQLNASNTIEGATLSGSRIVTMNMSLPKSLYELTGGQDTEFERYGGEDVEWGYRVLGAKSVRGYAAIRYSSGPAAEHCEDIVDVLGFCRKLYVAAYWGAPLILARAPQATEALTFRVCESGSATSFLDRGLHLTLNLVSQPIFVPSLARLLRRLDETRWGYRPLLFRALTLMVQRLAVNDRNCAVGDRSLALFS